MEDGEGAYNHDKESKGQNINVGNVETKSNRHKGRGEKETLMETVKRLKIEVQSYKAYNERLMREKNQINDQVMQILNHMHRKMDNGSNSKQDEEGRCHERRDDCRKTGYSRSARKNHRHHSSPYPTRKFYSYEDSKSSP